MQSKCSLWLYFTGKKIIATASFYQISNLISKTAHLKIICSKSTININKRQYFKSTWVSKYSLNYMYLHTRCLVGSTDQACSSGFYFRIAWKSMERPCFLQNHSLSFLQGLRSLKNWLLQKLSMKSLDQKF